VAVLEGERACTSDGPLDEEARSAVQALGNPQMHWVLSGFDDLIRCTQSPNGKLAVFTADAIPEAIRLARTKDGLYVTEAVRTILDVTQPHNSRKIVCLAPSEWAVPVFFLQLLVYPTQNDHE